MITATVWQCENYIDTHSAFPNINGCLRIKTKRSGQLGAVYLRTPPVVRQHYPHINLRAMKKSQENVIAKPRRVCGNLLRRIVLHDEITTSLRSS
ncbi:MAG: hypothetical protein AB1454_07460 [Candidatus Auribacterota bacterium]